MLGLGCPNMFYYVNLNSLEREKKGKVEGVFIFNIKKKFARNSHTWVPNKSTFVAVIKKKKKKRIQFSGWNSSYVSYDGNLGGGLKS